VSRYSALLNSLRYADSADAAAAPVTAR